MSSKISLANLVAISPISKNLGIENGFIEEMMSGQKWSRPSFMKRSIEAFERINDQLFESSYQANRYANVLMPILGNLGKCLLRLDLTGRWDLCLEWYQRSYYWGTHGLPPAQPFLQWAITQYRNS